MCIFKEHSAVADETQSQSQVGKKQAQQAAINTVSKAEEAKLEAVLRRACKPSRKGSLQVPETVHKMWKKGGNSRRELRKVLLRCQGDKDPWGTPNPKSPKSPKSPLNPKYPKP